MTLRRNTDAVDPSLIADARQVQFERDLKQQYDLRLGALELSNADLNQRVARLERINGITPTVYSVPPCGDPGHHA